YATNWDDRSNRAADRRCGVFVGDAAEAVSVLSGARRVVAAAGQCGVRIAAVCDFAGRVASRLGCDRGGGRDIVLAGRQKSRFTSSGMTGKRENILGAKLGAWKAKIVAFAGALGAPGLFLISFLDSSVLTFPVINDLLLIELSIQHPARMPVYALMAASGSVLGCVLLYFIARKGGEAFFHRKAGPRGLAIRHWVERNGFGGMLIAALLPPPTPFKVFVFAAGVFEAPLWSFASAISLAG